MIVSNNVEAYINEGYGDVILDTVFFTKDLKFLPRMINGNNIGMFQYQTELITNFMQLYNDMDPNILLLHQLPTFFNGFQLENTFADCHNLPGPAFIGWENIYNECEDYTYYEDTGIQVKRLNYQNSTENMFHNCYNLTGSPKVFEDLAITKTKSMYENCYRLRGNPVFPKTAIDVSRMYYDCHNLNGNANISTLAENIAELYYNCTNLGGTVQMSVGMTNMYRAYYNCSGIHGTIISTNSNLNLVGAFYNTGVHIEDNLVLNNVDNLSETFYNCRDIYGTITLLYNGDVNAHNSFYNRDVNRRLNIVVNENSAWQEWFLNVGTPCGDTNLIWDEYPTKYVNREKNLYLYCKGYSPDNDMYILTNTFNLDRNTTQLEFVQQEVI